MKGKQLLALLLAAVMMLGILAGCGGSGNETPAPASTPDSSSEGGEATNDISGKSIILISSARSYDGMDDAYQAACKQFYDETGCEVTTQFNGNFTELIQTFQAVKISGATYDMSSLGSGNLHQAVAKSGMVMDITPLAQQLKGRIVEGGIEQHTIDGHTFGIPFSGVSTMGFFVNRTMLDELGLDLQNGYTYDELKAVADAVKAAKGFTAVVHCGADWWWWPSWFFTTFAQETHNDSINQIEEWLKGNRSMEQEDAINAFNDILKFFQDGIMDADSLQYDGTSVAALFAQQKCLGFFASATNIKNVGDVDFDVDYLTYPVMVEGAIAQSSGGADEGINILTLGDPANVAASAKFIEFMTRPEVNGPIMQLSGNFGYAVKGVDGVESQISDEAFELYTDNTIMYLDWFWAAEHNDAVVKAIQGLVAQEIDGAEAAKRVQDNWQQTVDENDYSYEWWNSDSWSWDAVAMPYEVDLGL